MDVFAFREEFITEYEKFSQNFATIQAEDISQVVNEAYASGPLLATTALIVALS